MSSARQNDDAEQYRRSDDEPVTYPENHVIAVLDDEERVANAIEALVAEGFADAAVHVSCGAARADALRDSTGRRGLADLAIRIAERIGATDEEMEFKAHYEQALREGRYVLAIEALTEERKSRAVGILQQHGAHAVSYHGRRTIEAIVPPRDS